MEQLCETMTSGKWNKWLADHPSVVNMVNQVVAHSVCRVPITRKSKVPGTEDQPTTWQDLENDGVVYIGGSGNSTSCNVIELYNLAPAFATELASVASKPG